MSALSNVSGETVTPVLSAARVFATRFSPVCAGSASLSTGAVTSPSPPSTTCGATRPVCVISLSVWVVTRGALGPSSTAVCHRSSRHVGCCSVK